MARPSDETTRTHSRGRNIVVSVVFVFHLTALAWWNFGKGGLPDAPGGRSRGVIDDVLEQGVPAAADAIDPGHGVRDLLTGYVRATTTWQLWWMFAPDAPRQHGYTAMQGITGYEPDGRPKLDPVPFWGGENRGFTQHLIEISKPPCGVATPATDPRSQFFIRSYAEDQLAQHNELRTVPYIGVHYTCVLHNLPEPGQTELVPVGTWVLWSTPR